MKPASTLIISTYNWPQALELVFESIIKQTQLPSEIIIADDGSKATTKDIIHQYKSKIPVPVKQVWHEDIGFRKTVILNEAVRQSAGDYIIQIDGDIILHPKFIEDHIKNAESGYFIKGSRGRLTNKRTHEILKSKNIDISPLSQGLKSKINATRFTLLSRVFYGNPQLSRNVKGCNFAFWKSDFVKVNGYNNALEGWGHEDIEIAARLINSGVKCKQLKMIAVCYHLFHPINSRHKQKNNLLVYEKVIKQHIKKCNNGYAILNARRVQV